MASTANESRWKKYFQGRDITTRLKEKTKLVDPITKKKICEVEKDEIVLVPSTSQFLSKKQLGGVNHGIIVVFQDNTALCKFSSLSVPLQTRGATENLRINASILTSESPVEDLKLGEFEFKGKVFHSKEELVQCVLRSLDKINRIPPHIDRALRRYLSRGNFEKMEWPPLATDQEKNEIGKYFGEIIVGLVALDGKLAFPEAPQKDRINVFSLPHIKVFHLPENSNFSAIDSILAHKDGTLVVDVYPISSKYGKGAASSFMTNVLPVLMKRRVRSTTLERLCQSARKVGCYDGKRATEILYHWGFDHLLHYPVYDPMHVYEILRGHSKDNPHRPEAMITKIVKKIRSKHFIIEGNLDNVKNELPYSLTSFFARVLAMEINLDPLAKRDILDALSILDYWQVNLEQAKWRDQGIVSLKVTRAARAEIVVTGMASGMKTVSLAQGILNFNIRYI